MALLRRYQRFVDFDDVGRPLHPLSEVIQVASSSAAGTGSREGALFKGHAVVINEKKELLLIYDKARNEWKLPDTVYTNTKEQANRLLDKRYPGDDGKVIYSNMNNFDENQSRHRWTESIVKRYNARVGGRQRAQTTFAKGALPDNIRAFDSIILHSCLKW